MYAHGHKRSNRARIRAAKFVHEQELTQTPDKFELALVKRLYEEHKPVIWKRGQAFLGPVQLMRSTGKLTDAGEFLETQGWVSVARPA